MAQSTMSRTASWIGLTGGVGSVVLWIIMIFFNPYADNGFQTDVFVRTLSMLVLPALLAVYAAWRTKPILMYVALLWSFPLGVYLSAMPGIFKLFGVVLLLYLVSASSMSKYRQKLRK